jgi:pimeloyl-ACP methyl ester carboxylesterase
VSADIAEEILQQIRALPADLVIMRTHGRVGLERAVLGSVTQRVLAERRAPVMLMRPGERRISHIRKLLGTHRRLAGRRSGLGYGRRRRAADRRVNEPARSRRVDTTVQGRFDQLIPMEVAHTYYDALRSPHKEFVVFENSAHSPPFEEPDRSVS